MSAFSRSRITQYAAFQLVIDLCPKEASVRELPQEWNVRSPVADIFVNDLGGLLVEATARSGDTNHQMVGNEGVIR